MERQCKSQGKVKARQLERQRKGTELQERRQDGGRARSLAGVPGLRAVVASQTAGKQERNRIESFKYFAAEIMSTVTIQRLGMCCDAGLRHGQQARIPAGLWTASQTALSAAGPRKTAPSA